MGDIRLIQYTSKPDFYKKIYGETYVCNHPIYDVCTLFKIKDRGFAVIQQYCKGKVTYWSAIEPWLNNLIYTNEYFLEFFEENAEECTDGLYPTFAIRQVMHRLKMKPLKKEILETVFDRPIFK